VIETAARCSAPVGQSVASKKTTLRLKNDVGPSALSLGSLNAASASVAEPVPRTSTSPAFTPVFSCSRSIIVSSTGMSTTT
jgi:hypothetical protein